MIPNNLNTYVVGDYLIEPTIGMERSRGEVVIVARVTEIASNKFLTSGVFDNEQEYEAWVKELVKNWPV